MIRHVSQALAAHWKVDVDQGLHLQHSNGTIGLRDAFAILLDAETDVVHASVKKMMSPNDRRRVLLTVCDSLAADDATMPPEMCEALKLPPGATYSTGVARARLIIQEKEADDG